jgi:hypothetical protein
MIKRLTAATFIAAAWLGAPLAVGARDVPPAPASTDNSATSSPRTVSAPTPAAPGAMSVEKTSIGNLLANPGARAVLEKDLPKLIAYPGLDQIKDMTLRDISAFPESELDDAKLAAIQKDLDAAPR